MPAFMEKRASKSAARRHPERTTTGRPDPLVARFRILRGSESPHVRVADAPSSFISGASLTGVTAAAAAVVAERTGSSGH